MYPVERDHYIGQLKAFQERMGITNKKMAEILDITERTYSRFIAGEPIQREFDLIMRVYELSGRMMHEMTGAKVPREVENSQLYLQMDEQHRRLADEMLRVIFENQMRNK